LLYANKTEQDILLRKELDELAEKNNHKFKLYYALGWLLYNSMGENTILFR